MKRLPKVLSMPDYPALMAIRERLLPKLLNILPHSPKQNREKSRRIGPLTKKWLWKKLWACHMPVNAPLLQ